MRQIIEVMLDPWDSVYDLVFKASKLHIATVQQRLGHTR